MTNRDLIEKLRAAVAKMTPGPWERYRPNDRGQSSIGPIDDPYNEVITLATGGEEGGGDDK